MKSFKFQNYFLQYLTLLNNFEGFEFLAIGAAEADAGIYSSRKYFLKTVIF